MTDFVTAEDLDAALSHVMAAPRSDGPISMLLYRRTYNDRVFTDRLRLSKAGGVEGDFEMTRPWLKLQDGAPDPRIQVSILPQRVLDLCWRNRETVVHPGDQIIADLNMSLENLPAGSLIRAGTAILRVSDLWNDGCVKWKARCGRPAYAWVRAPAHEALRLRGIFCSIEDDGEVAVGDRIVRLCASV
jgi:hypothetical protein